MFKKIVLLILLTYTILAQEKDSSKTYFLDEIVIKTGNVEKIENLSKLSNKSLQRVDSDNLMEISKFLPSIKFQVNSRGENQIYFRGAGKRQLAVIFEGNNLNNPWDNLVDFSQIPIEAVDNISLTKGIPSITYGINSLAGALIITPKDYDGVESKSLKIGIGSEGHKRLSFNWLNGFNNFSYIVTLGYEKTDGFILPKSFELENGVRKNSYNENFNLYAKINYKYDNSDLGLSYSFINSEKGVPSEFFIAKPRYWKYPLWDKHTVNLNGNHFFNTNKTTFFTYSLAFTNFKLQIDDYSDPNYSKINLTEKNIDNFINFKFLLNHFINNNSLLKFVLSSTVMNHKENIQNHKNKLNFEEKYSQNTYQIGAEYEFIKGNFNYLAGLSFEGINTPEYGNNPTKNDYQDYTFVTSLKYKQTNNLFYKLNFGRKTRYPSLREAYSIAQGKFEINPKLKPETAYSLDFQVNYSQNNFYSDIIFFLNYTKDGINRATAPSGKFIRINKDMTRTFGTEISSNYVINSSLRLGASLTYMDSYAKNNLGEYNDTLEYKPKFIAGLNFEIIPLDDLTLISEVNYVASEFGLQESNPFFQILPSYFLINFRLSYLHTFNNLNIESYLRINNITDKLYYTQWGLPEAGRTYRFGLNFKI